MNSATVIRQLVAIVGFAVVSLGIYVFRDELRPWADSLFGSGQSKTGEDDHAAGPLEEAQQAKLSPQAQANLGLTSLPLKAVTFWKTVQTPGQVVDRPAQSDRSVAAPVTGVVSKMHRFPGDFVRPGETLATLKLVSETFHQTQSELFKTAKEIEINRDQRGKLAALAQTGAIAETRVTELDQQLRRLSVAAQAYRTELLARGLAAEQIDAIATGKFVSSIDVKAPPRSDAAKASDAESASPAKATADPAEVGFEVQELKVELGQQVQAGQTLYMLADHQELYIEGRAFRQESPLIEKAARESWPVDVEFMEDSPGDWPTREQRFVVRHIANTVDPVSRTFSFFIPLSNQFRSFEREGKQTVLWRFRPGQKVRLNLRVEKIDDVFVLPSDALVREGAETYIFRQNGDLFERKPVRVLHQDRRHVVIANDGSVLAGSYIAQTGAAQINRVLRSGPGGLPPGFHMHADGSIHSNTAH